MDFDGRHVVVTGGTGALGTAVVGTLLERGATCHVPWIHREEAERFPHRAHAGVRLVESGELSEEAAVERLYAPLPALWASVHIAGGFAGGAIEHTEAATLKRQVESNFLSCYLCCRAAVRAMLKSGGGRIVNVAARPALEWRAGAGMSAYGASKAAVAALTTALGEELAGRGILVNAVAPSTMDTPANRKSMPKANFDRWPKVEEVAAEIVHLASPANAVARGAIVTVYGKS